MSLLLFDALLLLALASLMWGAPPDEYALCVTWGI
jgi:hypothetical protein